MPKERKLEEILERLSTRRTITPLDRLDIITISIAIRSLLLEKMPKKKSALSLTTIDDPNLLIAQNYYTGFNQAIDEMKRIVEGL